MKNQYIKMLVVTLLMAASVCVPGNDAAAQWQRPTDKNEIIRPADGSKSLLWSRLKRWVALCFDSSQVIDMADPEAGTMVIKWSLPATQPSSIFSATLSGTYLIDVKDNKYRFRALQPKVTWTLMNPENLEAIPDSELDTANDDFRFINSIASGHYGGSASWDLDETFSKLTSEALARLSGINQFRNDRDREKGKSSQEWKIAERQWRILHDINSAYNAMTSSMADSLFQFMTTDDAF